MRKKIQTDFICLGVPKCGTTTLYSILEQHKDIIFPREGKNAYYYCEKGKNIQKFNNRYWGKQRYCENKIYGIIAENWYGRLEPEKIVKDFPSETKFIFMIRNPIERCYSGYKYTYAYRGLRGIDEKEYYKYNHQIGFKRYISRNIYNKESFIQSSKYDKIVSLYKLRAGKNVKIILLEDIKDNPEKVYKELMVFLEIKESKKVNYRIKANEGKFIPRNYLAGIIYGSFRTNFLQNILCWKYGMNNRNEFFALLFDSLFSVLGKLVKYDDDETKIDSETYKILKQYYSTEVKELEKILNRDLETVWNLK